MKKIAVVTGASSEIGKAICLALIKENYLVYAGARKTGVFSTDVKLIKAIHLDVTKNTQIDNLFQKINKKYGKLDLLVNLAGVTYGGRFADFEERLFKQMLEVNVLGVFRMIKKFYPLLKNSKAARVVNITSLAGIASFPDASAYCASKHALQALGEAARSEMQKDNIWITNLTPGAVETQKDDKPKYKTLRESSSMIRLILPMLKTDEIAKALVGIAKSDQPPAQVLLGNDTKLYYFLKRILPINLWNKILYARYGAMV